VATLLTYFADCFTFGQALNDALTRQGAYPRSSTDVYAELRSQIESAKLAAQQAQKREMDINEACFAVVAWLDEVIASHPDWWKDARQLQVSLFATNNAGNEFFTHLAKLTAEQDEVREVYYVALCLGFVGQYYYEVGDSGEIGRLKEIHGRQLPLPPVVLKDLSEEKVTLQPYRVADPPGLRFPARWAEMFLKGGIAASVAVVVGVLGYYLIQQYFESKPSVNLEPDIAAINGLLTPQLCHDFEVAKEESGNVVVSGHVPTPDAQKDLIAKLKALPAGEKIDPRLNVLAYPFCDIVELAEPFHQTNKTQNGGLDATIRGEKTNMQEGDLIAVDVTSPSYTAYLYVDYFVADGTEVVHLYPSAPGKEVAIVSSKKILVGEPTDNRLPWKVSPPFGREMVVAYASRVPLFRARRPEVEKVNEYLPILREALSAKEANAVAHYFFIQTEAKQ
jgi:type IV/VI secretion system ImpK/VasF family protein